PPPEFATSPSEPATDSPEEAPPMTRSSADEAARAAAMHIASNSTVSSSSPRRLRPRSSGATARAPGSPDRSAFRVVGMSQRMVMPSILDLSDPPSAPPCGAFRPPPARSARALPTRCQVLDHLGDVLAERGPRILLVQGLACQHRRIRGGPIIAEDEVGGDSDEPVEDLPDPHLGGMAD